MEELATFPVTVQGGGSHALPEDSVRNLERPMMVTRLLLLEIVP
jgi:hypothetical protein